jgi:hypothetical protein
MLMTTKVKMNAENAYTNFFLFMVE